MSLVNVYRAACEAVQRDGSTSLYYSQPVTDLQTAAGEKAQFLCFTNVNAAWIEIAEWRFLGDRTPRS